MMLKFHFRHGVIIDKILEIIWFKQNEWLEKYINFITRKRNKAKNELEKDFYILLNNAFYEKTLENLRNGLRLYFIKKYEYKKIIKWQSKVTFKSNS